MVNYIAVMMKKFQGKSWSIGDTYESLHWQSEGEKPTDASMQEYWVEIKNDWNLDKYRAIRNVKLEESDKYMLVDWPHSDVSKNEWSTYRINLRNLPSLYLEKMVAYSTYTLSGEYLCVPQDLSHNDLSGGDISFNFFPSTP
jgi:hypothetical protein|tara:strand:+ start:92 stop:517 length:426 start_codon:yes stop_codon:yes gene_type:complete